MQRELLSIVISERDFILSDIIGFHNIKMYQPKNSFRMTSDTLALVHFINPEYTDKNILDIGTGLGGIPLALSTKSKAHIVGVEIEKSIADTAFRSVSYNKLEGQIEIINSDIKDYANQACPNIFDIIVSNPPYFIANKGDINQNEIVARAKHNVTLELEDIMRVANKLLKDKGKLILVFTTERFIELINLYQKYHFAIKRIQFIYGNYDKGAKTFLIEGTKNGKMGMKVDFPIILESKKEQGNESKKL